MSAGGGDIPLTETIIGPAPTGWETRLDRFRIWVVAYGPFMLSYLPPKLLSPGFKLF